MKKSRRVVVALLTLAVLLLSVPGICSAAQQPPPPTVGQVSKDPGKSIVIYTRSGVKPMTGAQLISMWSTGISNNYDGTVTISGMTETYSVVDSLSVKVYLQRWNGSSWVDVTSRTFSNTNSLLVSDSADISVTRGYYYRTRGVHQATLNGSQDGTSSTSNSIYVN